MTGNQNFAEKVRTVQASILELSHHIKDHSLTNENIQYVCDSVSSGVEWFQAVTCALRSLTGPRGVTRSDRILMESLEQEFGAKYGEFLAESDFVLRCGLLLELFKLQLVFVGVSYD